MRLLTAIALTCLVVCWFASAASAQLASVYHEVFYQDDGTVSGYPEGATTYRIYASLQDGSDVLAAVYADVTNTILLGTNGGSGVWNSVFAGITGPEINPAFIAVLPQVRYDSMVTIGRADSSDLGGAIRAVSAEPSTTVFSEVFGTVTDGYTDTDLELIDGAWFSSPGEGNTVGVGVDFSVLLAQITTNGTIEYQLNAQVLDEGVGGNTLQYVWNSTNADETENVYDGSQLGMIFPTDCEVAEGVFEYTCGFAENAVFHNAILQMTTTAICAPFALVLLDEADGTATITVPIEVAQTEALQAGQVVDFYDHIVAAGADDGTYTLTLELIGDNEEVEIPLGSHSFFCGLLPGCTEAAACNYNPEANISDGSCSSWENGDAESAFALHVFEPGSQEVVTGSWACVDGTAGAWFCFEATDTEVSMALLTEAGNPITVLYANDLETPSLGVSGTFDLEGPHTWQALIPGDRYFLRIQMDEPTQEFGPLDFDVLLSGASGTPLPEDLNGDGFLSPADVLAFLGLYGTDDPSADLDGNGAVNTADLLALLYALFTAPTCD